MVNGTRDAFPPRSRATAPKIEDVVRVSLARLPEGLAHTGDTLEFGGEKIVAPTRTRCAQGRKILSAYFPPCETPAKT